VATIAVPYHLDEHVPDLDMLLRTDQVITADLPRAAHGWDRLAPLYTAVADAVSASAADGSCPVIVCGDCCTALGVVAGLQARRRSIGIVWFDAHGESQTPETTASGYLGGMPLRLLTGYRQELIASRLRLRPVPEQRVVLVGARDLDPPEVSYLATAAIEQRDVTTLVAADVPDMPLYVHVDLDVLDPAETPRLRYPAPDGPTAQQLASALRMLMATGRVAAVGVACTWYAGNPAGTRLGSLLADALAPVSP
jgi:arginase